MLHTVRIEHQSNVLLTTSPCLHKKDLANMPLQLVRLFLVSYSIQPNYGETMLSATFTSQTIFAKD